MNKRAKWFFVILPLLLTISSTGCGKNSSSSSEQITSINDTTASLSTSRSFRQSSDNDKTVSSILTVSSTVTMTKKPYPNTTNYKTSSTSATTITASKSNIVSTTTTSVAVDSTLKNVTYNDKMDDMIVFKEYGGGAIIYNSVLAYFDAIDNNYYFVPSPFGYTPPNYIKSTDPKHRVNYAIDHTRYMAYLQKYAVTYDLNPYGMGIGNPDLENRYSLRAYDQFTRFNNYENIVGEHLMKNGIVKPTEADRISYIERNNLEVKFNLYIFAQNNTNEAIYNEFLIELDTIMQQTANTGPDENLFKSLNAKYNSIEHPISIAWDSGYNGAAGGKITKSIGKSDGMYTITYPSNYYVFTDMDTYYFNQFIANKYGRAEMQNMIMELNVSKLLDYYNNKEFIAN
ncbi:MAG: hypothetical protein FWE80_04300 [Oscillospiraceae bacterium]|nr:hypothetical protein [Oscillospiraceae bacterium]